MIILPLMIISPLAKILKAVPNEAADLLYHFIILLKAKGMSIIDIEEELKKRSK